MIISSNNSTQEAKTQQDLFEAINSFSSSIFNAGAGAGKTFALIECLKYIVDNFGIKLLQRNQKIICITYTNVAVVEIKHRLGNSQIVEVSTIHERLWSLISKHQSELILIHAEKLKKEISELTNDLFNNSDEKVMKIFKEFRALNEENRKVFIEYMMDKKELFYSSYDKNSNDFKNAFNDDLSKFPKVLSNVVNFKKIVTTVYKIKNFQDCLISISAKDVGYQAVKYDSKFNSDILHRMIISHDTLIDYSHLLIKKYDLLKKILIDNFPYILVDEYQDTNPKVIDVFNTLLTYSKVKKNNFYLGYFGDSAQNIYSDGVGKIDQEKLQKLKVINKTYNRRSSLEVIKVINKIRNDEVVQIPIFENTQTGSVKFYHSIDENKMEVIDKFLMKYSEKWEIDKKNKLNCLVLTNKLVASLSGFETIYLVFSNSDFYKKNYDRLNNELLSHDLSKLGSVQRQLYTVINLISMLENQNSSLSSIISKEIYESSNLVEISKVLSLLKSLKSYSLEEFIKSLFNAYSANKESKLFAGIMNSLFGPEIISLESFMHFLISELYPRNDDAASLENAKLQIEKLIKLNFKEFKVWFDFINRNQDSNIIFHTYHSTKGLEFENVVIIMENDFGILNRDMFSSYFKNRLNPDLVLDRKEFPRFEKTKNLLYVSCSRAVKNLRILYLDDINGFREGVESLFEEIEVFNN
jgi:DNA helicase-2/ATP-dependent DNA helicase PcrA